MIGESQDGIILTIKIVMKRESLVISCLCQLLLKVDDISKGTARLEPMPLECAVLVSPAGQKLEAPPSKRR